MPEITDVLEQRYLLPITLLTCATVVYMFAASSKRSKPPLPPGPPQKWITGNVHQFPTDKPWLTYQAWTKIYGPIFHLRIINQHWIVLNSLKAAQNLLESCASTYSDRPVFNIFNIAKRSQEVFMLSSEHPQFRKYRRLLHSGLNPRVVQSYRDTQTKEVNTLLRGLVETPKDFIPHIRRNAAALILNVTYGYQVSGDDDKLVNKIKDFLEYSTEKFKKVYIVEFLPILRFLPTWTPFVEFHEVAQGIQKLAPEAEPFQWTKNKMDSGEYVESFASKLLRPEDGPPADAEEEEIIKWCCSGLFFGGADTTVSVMTNFFMLMMLYPEVQKRAQSDIDAVTGKERLPTLDDQKFLPYISAVIKEVARWGPVAPLGLLHSNTKDDVYEGYFIPKGSTVVANIWAMTHDPELYPDPDTFNPDRHLGEKHQFDPFKLVFGFGRRVCPGAHFAEQSLFLTASNILAAFDIKKQVDENGNIVEPSIEWTGSTVAHLAPFPCSITPRTPGEVNFIQAVYS